MAVLGLMFLNDCICIPTYRASFYIVWENLNACDPAERLTLLLHTFGAAEMFFHHFYDT